MNTNQLLHQNREWVTERTRSDPDYFKRQASRHQPHSLFIGCSDARVPSDQITGTDVGELFVHRNIANQVVATDNNLMAVVQYAVEVLEVRDIIVCGHEECGGVKASLGSGAPAHVDGWLTNVRNVARLHEAELDRITDTATRCLRLVELNVREQVRNLSRLPFIAAELLTRNPIRLHGWVYGLSNGLLRDLRVDLAADGPRGHQLERRKAG